MLNKEQARAVIKKVGGLTKHYAVVSVSAKDEGTTRFANSEINQNVSVADVEVSVTLYEGKKEATCATNVLTSDGLQKMVRDAENILQFAPEGEYGAFEFPKEEVSSGDIWPLAQMFGVKERAEYIKEGVAPLGAGCSAAGALALTQSVFAVGNHSGAFRYAASEYLAFNTVVTYGSGVGGGQVCAHTPGNIDIKAEFIKAYNTAKAARNPVKADIGAYTVVLSPLAFNDLMYYASVMHNAKYVEDGISYTIGNIGKKVFGTNITFRDDVNCPGTRPHYFDFEGNTRRPVTLVENGVVKGLLYDNKSAAKQGVLPARQALSSGHAVNATGDGGFAFNLVIEGGDSSLEEMIAGIDKGIYVNEFHYTNAVNDRNLQITGLTRNGTFLIENGKLAAPIANMRFTQSLIDALNNVTALSKDLTRVPGFDCVYYAPSAKIEGFHFTS